MYILILIYKRLFYVYILLGMYWGHSQNNIRVHDPVVIKQNDTYHLFCTGNGISNFTSKDLIHWQKEKPVFPQKPNWANNVVPGFENHIWAPDISYHNGKYYLYYSISKFGKNTSAIGIATNTTLNHEDVDFKWIDHGIVLQSVPNRDSWNAIDPNLTFDENNIPWLAFGSFWGGLKIVKLDENLTALSQPEEWHTIAKRESTFISNDSDPGNAALEAPFIFKSNGYFYQFLSWDYCCRGEKSTYRVVMGRSKNITGPYLDKKGKPLNEGGGTVIIEGNENWYGAGHNSVYTFNKKDYIFFHAYDAKDKGIPKLQIAELEWSNSHWPILKTITLN